MIKPPMERGEDFSPSPAGTQFSSTTFSNSNHFAAFGRVWPKPPKSSCSPSSAPDTLLDTGIQQHTQLQSL